MLADELQLVSEALLLLFETELLLMVDDPEVDVVALVGE